MKIVYIITSILFILYLIFPNPEFPKQLPNSLQSSEPADIETALRRSYFADTDREDVMNFFSNEFANKYLKYRGPSFRLNYPPEEAQTIIRDQTRSTYLEEVVHPFRESLFINGYEPKENKDVIFVDGKFWKYKITVKLQQSATLVRLFVGLAIIAFTPLLYLNIIDSFKDFSGGIRNLLIRVKKS